MELEDLQDQIKNRIGIAELPEGPRRPLLGDERGSAITRTRAIAMLPGQLKVRGMELSDAWQRVLIEANAADKFDCQEGGTGLRNTSLAIDRAIQDALYRKEGGEGKGLEPRTDFFGFFKEETRVKWEEMMRKQQEISESKEGHRS